jgi:hypothetical protein
MIVAFGAKDKPVERLRVAKNEARLSFSRLG